jgi:hypothetical protein
VETCVVKVRVIGPSETWKVLALGRHQEANRPDLQYMTGNPDEWVRLGMFERFVDSK